MGYSPDCSFGLSSSLVCLFDSNREEFGGTFYFCGLQCVSERLAYGKEFESRSKVAAGIPASACRHCHHLRRAGTATPYLSKAGRAWLSQPAALDGGSVKMRPIATGLL